MEDQEETNKQESIVEEIPKENHTAEFKVPLPVTTETIEVVREYLIANEGKKFSKKSFERLVNDMKAAAWDSCWKKVIISYER